MLSSVMRSNAHHLPLIRLSFIFVYKSHSTHGHWKSSSYMSEPNLKSSDILSDYFSKHIFKVPCFFFVDFILLSLFSSPQDTPIAHLPAFLFTLLHSACFSPLSNHPSSLHYLPPLPHKHVNKTHIIKRCLADGIIFNLQIILMFFN